MVKQEQEEVVKVSYLLDTKIYDSTTEGGSRHHLYARSISSLVSFVFQRDHFYSDLHIRG